MNRIVGQQLPEQSFSIGRAQLVRYAGASGDFNPIHWSDRAARAAGLPDVLAHGMLTMALAGRVLTDWLGDPGNVLEFRTRFAAPLPISPDEPTTVVAGGEVVEVRPDGTARVQLHVRCGETEVLTRVEALVKTSGSTAMGVTGRYSQSPIG